MIQTLLNLQESVKDINAELSGPCHIQKIYSSTRFISFQVRIPGKSVCIYLGRGKNYEGIWNSTLQINSKLRVRDVFLEYLRKYISSVLLTEIYCDKDDRSIIFSYSKNKKACSIGFFYKARNLYMFNHFWDEKSGEMKLFRSWNGKKEQHDDAATFDIFNEVGRREIDSNKKKDLIKIEKLLQDEEIFYLSTKDNKEQKKENRKIKNIEKDYLNTKKWQELSHYVESSFEGLGNLPNKCKIINLSFNFENSNPYHRRDKIYLRIKKLKAAEKILEKRLLLEKEKIKNKKTVTVTKNLAKPISIVWNEINKTIQVRKEKDDYKVYTFEDFKLAVGLSANGNNQIRSKFSSRDDYWFHLDNLTSAHAVVKLSDSDILTEGIIKKTSKILAEYSNFTDSMVPIIYTQVKNVKAIKGIAGTVNYKKEKHMMVKIDE